ncbi:MAG TPA: flavin monoamine oxidase family protein [Actinomycetota bacterium]|nr:flavin monoamine oxidase family protein [Actinomycetota bacterium]
MDKQDKEELAEAGLEDELVEAGAPDPDEAAPPDPEVMEVAEEGLEPIPQHSKKVIVIGAGIAGLVAAYELLESGHRPVILEAQNRVGGRIYTLRSFAPGLYAEAGAMRIPRAHTLTLKYCEQFGLELRPFMMGNPKGLVYIGGQRMTMEQAAADPSSLPYELSETEAGRDINQIWEEAIADLRELIATEGDEGWDKIVKEYDKYSLRQFLELKGFSEGAIELFGVMNFVEADMGTAAIELLREDLGGAYVDMQEIVGGMDRLPNSFYERLKNHIRFGANVHALDQDESSVTVHFKTESGRYSETADYAIVTVPFSVLRTIEVMKPFSKEKQKAIRQLHYAASTKILFQVRNRFWEKEDGIFGGATVTDLAIRRMNYPTPDAGNERGMLLASYTWSQDAARWGAMDNETRLEEALDDVSRIHPSVRDAYEVGTSHAWYDDPYAGGAFALFEPGQQSSLHEAILAPEGRYYFAGEHCSLYHAWIQGSLESGINAAREIHEAPVEAKVRQS